MVFIISSIFLKSPALPALLIQPLRFRFHAAEGGKKTKACQKKPDGFLTRLSPDKADGAIAFINDVFFFLDPVTAKKFFFLYDFSSRMIT